MQHTPRFGLRSSQHHRSWQQIRANFIAADEWGWESAWVFDHMLPLSDPRTGPNLEGWTLLAGLAEATNNVLLGTMVTGITYRNPTLLLKEAVTVDHISNGRCLLGVGAAWFEGEHEMFGFEFPPVGQRVDMFREALQMFEQLQTQECTTFDGVHYQLREAIFEPKPVRQPKLPVVIGAGGDRMLRLVARYADQWDNNFSDEADYLARRGKLEAACAAIGRDPSEIRRSTTVAASLAQDEGALRALFGSYRKLGITDFLIHAPDNVEDLRDYAERIVPSLREEWAS